MAIFSFFKPPKHQRFSYIPQHWDPDKEDLHRRVRVAENRQADSTEEIKARISGGFRRKNASQYQVGGRSRSSQVRRSNMILFSTIVILIILAYVLIQVYLPRILNLLE